MLFSRLAGAAAAAVAVTAVAAAAASAPDKSVSGRKGDGARFAVLRRVVLTRNIFAYPTEFYMLHV